MNRKKTAIVIGTGAGGATIAKELQGKYRVTILEHPAFPAKSACLWIRSCASQGSCPGSGRTGRS